MTWNEYLEHNYPSYSDIEDIIAEEDRLLEQALELWENENNEQ